MLIVAIPKSASTSLMKTLGELHQIPAEQIFFETRNEPAEVRVLSRYHSDICEFEGSLAKRFAAPDHIYKQHVPPTRHNLELLANVKKVILLRPPADIIEAYFRATQKKIHEQLAGFEDCTTFDEWEKRAEQTGLKADLSWFFNEWTNEADRMPEQNLIVYFSDVVADPQGSINRIEDHFGLRKSADVSLARERYSRGGTVFTGAQILRKTMRNRLKNFPRLHRLLRGLKNVFVD